MDDPLAATGGERCRFGAFEFDARTLELTKAGRAVSLRFQPLKLLALLLARPGDLISRDELQKALWRGDTFVDFAPAAAHRWLHTAADTEFPCLPFFERDPLLEPLRRRADFSQLLQHVRDRRALVQAAGTHG